MDAPAQPTTHCFVSSSLDQPHHVNQHTGIFEPHNNILHISHLLSPSPILPIMAELNPEASDTASNHANETDSPQKPRLPSIASAVPIEPRPIAAYPDPRLQIPPPLYVPGVTYGLWQGKPVDCYIICEKKFIMLKVENETLAEFQRTTVGGRSLRYRLHVIQEPAKARACGSGPRCKYPLHGLTTSTNALQHLPTVVQ